MTSVVGATGKPLEARRQRVLRRWLIGRMADQDRHAQRPSARCAGFAAFVGPGRRALDGMAAELVAQRGEHAVGEVAVAARAKARVQRGGDHRRRDVVGGRVLDRPAALAGVLGVALDRLPARCRRPRTRARRVRTATSAPPSPGPRGGRSWRCRARTRTCRTGRSPRRRPASARTRRRCGPSSRSAPRRRGRSASSRAGRSPHALLVGLGRQHVEDRREALDGFGGAADHHAVADFKAPHAAGGADVDVVDPGRLQLLRRGACRRSTWSCRRRRSCRRGRAAWRACRPSPGSARRQAP